MQRKAARAHKIYHLMAMDIISRLHSRGGGCSNYLYDRYAHAVQLTTLRSMH